LAFNVNVTKFKEVKKMRKIATILLLIVSIGFVFAGAVSAQEPATVDVTVVDDNGDPAVVTNPGDDVGIDVLVQANDEEVVNPYVNITVDPEDSLILDPENAAMTIDGVNWIYNDDPIFGGFFYWNAMDEQWVWVISQFGTMDPGDATELFIPAVVATTGEITVNADLIGGNEQRQFVILDSDSYTFLSVEPIPVRGATVPMQNTGAPLAALALGMLSIIGGAVYGKLR
jgi:hypothetical protein